MNDQAFTRALVYRTAVLLVFGSTTLFAPLARGQNPDDLIKFVLDPAQSWMTVSGTTQAQFGAVVPLQEQFPGAFTTSISGSIIPDFGLFPTLTFTTSSLQLAPITPANQTQPAQPGAVTNQFAAYIPNYPSAGQTSYVAFQQLVLIERSGTAHYDNGVLTTDQIVFGFPGGWALVAAPGLYNGELGLSGNDINLASPGSLLPFGSGYQLTIPFSFEDDITGLNLHFSGQIVAYSKVVPEQSSGVLLLIGAGCLTAIACRRRSMCLSRFAC